jgi:hypothetical protein
MNKQINKERRDTMETNRNTQKQNNTKAEHVREKESDRERRSTVVRVVVSRLEDGGGLDQCFHLQSTPSFFLNLLCLFFVLCDGAVIDSGGLLWKAVMVWFVLVVRKQERIQIMVLLFQH